MRWKALVILAAGVLTAADAPQGDAAKKELQKLQGTWVPVSLTVNGKEFRSQKVLRDFMAHQDCAIVVADHDSIDWTLVLQYSPIVVDTRNVLGRLSPAPAMPGKRAERRVD